MEHWNLDIIGIEFLKLVAKLKRTWKPALVVHIVQKIPKDYCLCLYLSVGQAWWLNKLLFKKCTVLCTNTHHDVTDLVNCGMVKNTKTWISWERNLTSLRNKKILKLCLGWHILRSYHFVAEVSFKYKSHTDWKQNTWYHRFFYYAWI